MTKQLLQPKQYENTRLVSIHGKFLVVLIAIIICFSFTDSYASQISDSLLKSLETLKGTERVDALNQLSEYALSFSASKAGFYAEQALQQAGEIRYTLGIAKSYENLSLIALYRGELQHSLITIGQAIIIYKNAKEDESLYRSLMRKAGCYQYLNDNTRAIETFLEAMNLATEGGHIEQQAAVSTNLSLYFLTINDYVNAKFYVSKAMLYARMSKQPNGIGLATCAMGDYYSAVKQNQEALDYYHRSLLILSSIDDKNKMATCYVRLGNHQVNNEQYESAIESYEKALELYRYLNDILGQANLYTSLAHVYQQLNQLNKALEYQKLALKLRQDFGHMPLIGSSFTNIGTVYTLLKDYSKALYYFSEGLRIAQQTKRTDYIKFNYQRIYELYIARKDYQKALQINLLISAINDSILKNESQQKYAEFQYKYENEEKLQNINFLTKENEIQKLSLKQTRLIIYVMAATLFLLLIIGVLLYYQSILSARHRQMDLEQKLLRSQMNPHFIFNALIAIQSFIFKNESSEAAHYITSFARLIRLVLSNSREEFVTLQREIDTLSNYLSLQKMRFDNKFDYSLVVDPELETELIKIPPMLAQPFVEDSIEQGIFDKGWPGRIIVTICEKDNNIHIEVLDNCIGRTKGKDLSDKSLKSYEFPATRLTEERIANLNRKYQQKIRLYHTDLFDENRKPSGTTVLLIIPEQDK